jgi:hypothetical protein
VVIPIVFDHFLPPFFSFNQKVIIQGIKFKGNFYTGRQLERYGHLERFVCLKKNNNLNEMNELSD